MRKRDIGGSKKKTSIQNGHLWISEKASRDITVILIIFVTMLAIASFFKIFDMVARWSQLIGNGVVDEAFVIVIFFAIAFGVFSIRRLSELRDETIKRKYAEEELKAHVAKLEQAISLKDLFHDIVHHDLMNPVSVIKTAIDIELESVRDDRARDALLMMQRNVDRLIETINSASSCAMLAEVEDIEQKMLDMNNILRASAANLEHKIKEKNMKLDILSRSNCYTIASPIIGNAFSNLISNAIRYSPEGGRIEANTLCDDKYCTFYVKDWGYGIKDRDKGNIFTRFQRANTTGTKGTGLGLAIVKRIVDIHKGKVWVEDNPEGGCVFYMQIPKTSDFHHNI